MAGETEIERMVVRLIGDATQYQTMLREAQEATARAANEVKNAGTRMESVQRRLEAVGHSMTRVGRRMSLMVTAPLAGIAALATRESVGFGGALTKMQSLVGLSAEEVQGFREEILKLAPAVGKSPVELAEAMFFITSAGMRGAQALETLTITSKAAAMGMGDTKSVADAVTSAINAYGQANLSATQATEILTAAVKEGKSEASSFAPVMGQILPTANELGISFDQAAGAIAFMTKATGSAGIAATGLRGVMTQIIRPNRQLTKLVPWLTTEWYKQSIAIRGLHPTLMLLKERLEEQHIPLSRVFSDIEGLNAVLQLTGPNAAVAAEVIRSVGESAGIVATGFQFWEATMGAGFAKRMAEIRVLLINLGEMLAPVMSNLIDWSTMLIRAWENMSPATQRVVAVMAALLAAIGPTLTILGTMAITIGALGGPLTGVCRAVQLLTTAMMGLSAAQALTIVGLAALAAGAIYAAFQLGKTAVAEADLHHEAERYLEDLRNFHAEDTLRVNRLQQLAEAQKLDNYEVREAKDLIKVLTERYGDFGAVLDETTGKLKLNAEAMSGLAMKMRVEKIIAMAGEVKEVYENIRATNDAITALSEKTGVLNALSNAIKGAGLEAERSKLTQQFKDLRKELAAAVGGESEMVDLTRYIVGVYSPEMISAALTKKLTEAAKDAGEAAGEAAKDAGEAVGNKFVEGLEWGIEIQELLDWMDLQDKAMRRAAALAREVETPQEKYNRRIKELGGLLEMLGPKFEETYRRQMKAAKKELDEATKDRTAQIRVNVDYGGVQALEAGSAAAKAFAAGYLESIGGIPRMAPQETGATTGKAVPVVVRDVYGGLVGAPGELFPENITKLLERIAEATEGTDEKLDLEPAEID